MGGPQCRMSILRNGNVTCPCRLFSPMSHVEFKKRLCHMSLRFLAHVVCHLALCRMSNLRNGDVSLSILGSRAITVSSDMGPSPF